MQELSVSFRPEHLIEALFPGSLKSKQVRSKVKGQAGKKEFLKHLDGIAELFPETLRLNSRWYKTEAFIGITIDANEKAGLIERFAEAVGQGKGRELYRYLGCLAVHTGKAEIKNKTESAQPIENEGLVMFLSLEPAKGKILDDYFKYAAETGFRDTGTGTVVPTIDILNLTLFRQIVLIMLATPKIILEEAVTVSLDEH